MEYFISPLRDYEFHLERNMIYILHGEMEGLKIEMKCGLVFRSGKERRSRFLRSDLDLTEVEP